MSHDRWNDVSTLCQLQSEVSHYLDDWTYAADCFCMYPALGGNDPEFWSKHYRNDGRSICFIQKAVRKAIEEGMKPDAD